MAGMTVIVPPGVVTLVVFDLLERVVMLNSRRRFGV